MAVCPKCSYALVLLEHRNKYKCALCSRLFSQKEIDDREFKEWNKRQRTLDAECYEKELKVRKAQLKELRKHMKYLFNGLSENYKKKICRENNHLEDKNPSLRRERCVRNKEWVKQKYKEYYYKNRERLLEQDEKWAEANKERISLKCKKWLEKNKDKWKEFLKAYRTKNEGLERQKLRLAYWRKKQERLADEYLKNDAYEACTISF